MYAGKEESKVHHVLKQFVKVYQMLEDEESRDIYLKKLDVLISGDLKYTDNIVTRLNRGRKSKRHFERKIIRQIRFMKFRRFPLHAMKDSILAPIL